MKDPRRLLELEPRVIAEKARRRAWSARRALSMVRDVADTTPPAPPTGGLHVQFVAPDEFEALAGLAAEATGIEYLYVWPIERTRQARAGTLAVARNDAGDLMGFHFVHEAHDYAALQTVAPDMYPLLPSDEVLTEALYVLPAFRDHSVASTLLQTTGALLAERGIRRAWAWNDTTNRRAIRTFHRAGYVAGPQERVDLFRLGRHTTEFRPVSAESEAVLASVVAEAGSGVQHGRETTRGEVGA
jgi:GNAT superfamily N-acetyltransferase